MPRRVLQRGASWRWACRHRCRDPCGGSKKRSPLIKLGPVSEANWALFRRLRKPLALGVRGGGAGGGAGGIDDNPSHLAQGCNSAKADESSGIDVRIECKMRAGAPTEPNLKRRTLTHVWVLGLARGGARFLLALAPGLPHGLFVSLAAHWWEFLPPSITEPRYGGGGAGSCLSLGMPRSSESGSPELKPSVNRHVQHRSMLFLRRRQGCWFPSPPLLSRCFGSAAGGGLGERQPPIPFQFPPPPQGVQRNPRSAIAHALFHTWDWLVSPSLGPSAS